MKSALRPSSLRGTIPPKKREPESASLYRRPIEKSTRSLRFTVFGGKEALLIHTERRLTAGVCWPDNRHGEGVWKASAGSLQRRCAGLQALQECGCGPGALSFRGG